MISDSLKLIFMHIPKTAGSSVTYFLRNYANENVELAKSRLGPGKGVSVNDSETGQNVKHIPLHKLLKKNPEYQDYFKFTVVRNPYDRVMSYYFWHKGNRKCKKEFDKDDFKRFVRQLGDFQSNYIYDPETGELLVDKIVKFESLVTGLSSIPRLSRFNFSNLPKLNVSRNEFQRFYDNELKDLVWTKFKKDFELLGYQK